jgi:hypothetical protein
MQGHDTARAQHGESSSTQAAHALAAPPANLSILGLARFWCLITASER